MRTRLPAAANQAARGPHCVGTKGSRVDEPEAGTGLHLGDERRPTAPQRRPSDHLMACQLHQTHRESVGGPVTAVSNHTPSAWRTAWHPRGQRQTRTRPTEERGQVGPTSQATAHREPHTCPLALHGCLHASLPLILKNHHPLRRPALPARAQVTTLNGHHETSRPHQHLWCRPGSTHTAGLHTLPGEHSKDQGAEKGHGQGATSQDTTGRRASEAAMSMGPAGRGGTGSRPLRQEVTQRPLSRGDPSPQKQKGRGLHRIPAPSPGPARLSYCQSGGVSAQQWCFQC